MDIDIYIYIYLQSVDISPTVTYRFLQRKIPGIFFKRSDNAQFKVNCML